MTFEKMVNILKDEYLKGLKNKQAMTNIHLFGIKYANYLEDYSLADLDELSLQATGKSSFGVEISKGRKLSEYVILK